MKNKICEMFGIEAPILAFTHCRDVAAEVSKAGGMGVLGLARISPAKLHDELNWLDSHIFGKPYGIDVLMPSVFEDTGTRKYDLDCLLPREQVNFLTKLLDDAGIPRLSESEEKRLIFDAVDHQNFTPRESLAMIDSALEHPVKLIVSALGTPPRHLIEMAHKKGIRVAALAGKVEHAIKHKEAGCDFVIAVGTEAGGHTGDIASMVLWPQIVDAVAPLPVLGAGGVGRGRQLAAALALGCEGVWCGSIWLKTVESDVPPDIKKRLLGLQSSDAVLSKSWSGKQCRVMRSSYTDAWLQPGAPKTLPSPLQAFLCFALARPRIERARAEKFLTFPVGQIVGDMNEETSVRNVVHDMLAELLESKERLDNMFG